MTFDDYKAVIYRSLDGWVVEIPASRDVTPMPSREEALAELAEVFRMIAASIGTKASHYHPTPLKSFMPSASCGRSRFHGRGSVTWRYRTAVSERPLADNFW